MASQLGFITRTQLRRAQRKHTQHSYLVLKAKLQAVVTPLPRAIPATDLETFRAELYDHAFTQMGDDQPVQSTTCISCGLWSPLSTVPRADSPWHSLVPSELVQRGQVETFQSLVILGGSIDHTLPDGDVTELPTEPSDNPMPTAEVAPLCDPFDWLDTSMSNLWLQHALGQRCSGFEAATRTSGNSHVSPFRCGKEGLVFHVDSRNSAIGVLPTVRAAVLVGKGDIYEAAPGEHKEHLVRQAQAHGFE